MTLSMILATLFEIILFAAVVWGIFNEDKLVAFERGIFYAIKRRRQLKVIEPSPARRVSDYRI